MTSQKSKQAKRLSNSRAEVLVLKEQVQEIKNNHLVHLAADVKSLDTKVDSINEHVMWIKSIFPGWEQQVKKLDERTFYILTSIILGFLATLVMFGLNMYLAK